MVLIVEWGFKGLLPKRSATGRHAASPLLIEEGWLRDQEKLRSHL